MAPSLPSAPNYPPIFPTCGKNIAAVLSIREDQSTSRPPRRKSWAFTGAGEGIAAQAVALLEKI